MILFVTTAAHRYTVNSLVDRTFGADVPHCAVVAYEELFAAATIPTATWIFTDLDRLFPWEVAIAGEIFRWMRGRGLRCLNDPARAMGRFELLRSLHRTGFNPFDVHRGDERPQPRRFPVFVRNEADHVAPRPALLHGQAQLDGALARLQGAGVPLRGLLVVEYAGEEIAPGMWRKFATFRAGDGISVSHAYVADSWLVKLPTPGLATEAHHREELAAVAANRPAGRLGEAFAIAGIEWGRADHAVSGGRDIVFEINVNPNVPAMPAEPSPIRRESLLLGRRRLARHLHDIDTPGGPALPFAVGPRLARWRGAMARDRGAFLPRP
ncbi:MAG: hypothetical protein AB7P02_21600 [Alphaproteobacteria bacterium]